MFVVPPETSTGSVKDPSTALYTVPLFGLSSDAQVSHCGVAPLSGSGTSAPVGW